MNNPFHCASSCANLAAAWLPLGRVLQVVLSVATLSMAAVVPAGAAVLYDNGAPSSLAVDSLGSYINTNSANPLAIYIYDNFLISPSDSTAPYGWKVNGFRANFYINDGLSPTTSITEMAWSIRQGMAQGVGGSVVNAGQTQSVTIIQTTNDTRPDTLELYEITMTIPDLILDVSNNFYWLAVTPLIDSLTPPDINLALTQLPPPPIFSTSLVNNAFYFSPGFYNYVPVVGVSGSPLNRATADFSMSILGDKYQPPANICSSANPPSYCNVDYPDSCLSETPSSLCLPPPPSFCQGSKPPVICGCSGPNPNPGCQGGGTIPEPTTTALLSLGLAGLGLYQRRRRENRAK